MMLPPFSKFIEEFDHDKFAYDLKQIASSDLSQSNNLFSQQQYDFLCKTSSTMAIALLQQYHQWLAEQLSQQYPAEHN